MKLRAFWSELRRRRVLQAGSLYLAGAWVLLQVLDTLSPELNLPRGSMRIALIGALGLFPFVLASAWVFDLQRTPAAALAVAVSEASRLRVPKLVVLPFKPLRPDPDTDFLAFSLPEAIICSLAELDSLAVQSSAATMRLQADLPLEQIAARTQADLVLTGSLLRVQHRLSVNTELIELPGGRVIAARRDQLPFDDLFAVQDHLTRGILESLQIPLNDRAHRSLVHYKPASNAAYELFLRGNQLAFERNDWAAAVPLYIEALAADPVYAPAWARLGRAYRLIAKYTAAADRIPDTLRLAESAFRRALEINPELALAHSQYALLEVDMGRVTDAMTRLLERLHRKGDDVEVNAGLVQACRFAGLLHASVRAHDRVRTQDAHAATSVAHTHVMLGEYEAALTHVPAADIGYLRGVVLALLGREREAIATLSEDERVRTDRARAYLTNLRAALQGNREEALATTQLITPALIDTEGAYYLACTFAHLGEDDAALEYLRTALDRGYCCVHQMQRDAWLAPLRTKPVFRELIERAHTMHQDALAAYERVGGPALLGPELPALIL